MNADQQRLDRRREAEANTFALAILMPAPLVRSAYRKMGGLSFVDDEPLDRLARQFGVTHTAMMIRLVQLGIPRIGFERNPMEGRE